MQGKYTVNEVEERTKVPASTLRQWERRYGFPMPERSESSGYRLYSEHDLRQIEAMKRHVEDGVPASRAAALVQQLGVVPQGPRPVQVFIDELVAAFVALDDARADEVLSEAHALYSVEQVMLELMQSAVNEIGKLWHEGKIRTTTEHFASQYVQGRLRALLSLSPKLPQSSKIIVACAPGDHHELGALMLAVMLRRKGYRVYYLGANTPVADLIDMAQSLKPVAVMISASVSESIHQLQLVRKQLRSLSPLLIFGGWAFDAHPEIAQGLGGVHIGNDIPEATSRLDKLIGEVKT